MEKLSENDLAKIVVQIAYEIHVKLGPGLFESVYEEILFTELTKRGLHVERQKAIYIQWDNKTLGSPAFRALSEKHTIQFHHPIHQTTPYKKHTLSKTTLRPLPFACFARKNTPSKKQFRAQPTSPKLHIIQKKLCALCPSRALRETKNIYQTTSEQTKFNLPETLSTFQYPLQETCRWC